MILSYVGELRKIVGNRPIILIGATVLVRNVDGALLFQLRSDTCTWGLPGGAMEPGESLVDTARRELLEESGLEAREFRLIGVLSGPEYFFTYPNGDQAHCVIGLYEAIGVRGELTTGDEETEQLSYFALDNLPKLESRAARVVNHLLECGTTDLP